MPDPETYFKTTPFDEVDGKVRNAEGLYGKLKSINIEGDYTVANFVDGPSYPADRLVKLQRVPNDQVQPPDGYMLVCRGECWDNPPNKTKVIAIRKKKKTT